MGGMSWWIHYHDGRRGTWKAPYPYTLPDVNQFFVLECSMLETTVPLLAADLGIGDYVVIGGVILGVLVLISLIIVAFK